jgi:queuine/archaeosine tRNA-ribosyltransferase
MQLMFANTYHLLLQPGPATVAAFGGLHSFIGRRNRPLITDSGGFQIFSLQHGGVTQELATGGSEGGNSSLKRAAARHTAGGSELPEAGGSGLRRNAASGVVKCAPGACACACTYTLDRFRRARAGSRRRA